MQAEQEKVKVFMELLDTTVEGKLEKDTNRWTKWLIRYAQRLHAEIGAT